MASRPKKAAEDIASQTDQAKRLSALARDKLARVGSEISTMDGHVNAINLAAIALEMTIRAAEADGLRITALESSGTDAIAGRCLRFDVGQIVDPIYD